MSLSDKLKPCPFCGAQPIENEIEPHRHHFCGLPDHPGSHVIECRCGAGLIDDTREKVFARWNTRAIERAATIAAMRRCVEICFELADTHTAAGDGTNDCIEKIETEIARLEAEK